MPKRGRKKLTRPSRYSGKITTEQQEKFLDNITTEGTETYFEPVKSLWAAGYSQKQNPEYAIGRLLCNKNILDGLLKALQRKSVLSEIKQETAKDRIWRELELALTDCKTGKDMTNRIRVIELMGKYHQLWSDKQTINIIETRELSDERRQFLKRIASTIVLESCLLPPDAPESTQSDDITRLEPSAGSGQIVDCEALQSYCGPIVNPTQLSGDDIIGESDTQAVVGDGDEQQAITDNTDNIPDSTDCNNSNNNEL